MSTGRPPHRCASRARASLCKKFYLLLSLQSAYYPATPLERRRCPLGGIVGCKHRLDLAVVERVDKKHLE